MFQLQISDMDATNGSIPVSWCLDEETIKLLADCEVKEPQVVICVAPINTKENSYRYHVEKEYRKIVPLKDLMTYIEFRSSGPNKIWGFISFKKKKDATNLFLEKYKGAYSSSFLNYQGDDYSLQVLNAEGYTDQQNKTYKRLSAPLLVDVPQGVFAPEPAQWEKDWVNYFFKNKVVDQCDFRKRRILAYTFQPIVFFFNLLIRFVILMMATLIVSRGWSLKWFLHPIIYSLGDNLDIFDNGSILVFHLPEDNFTLSGDIPSPGYFVRSFWLAPLMPLFWAPIALLFFCGAFKVAGIVAATIAMILGIILLLSISIHYLKFLSCLGKPFVSLIHWMLKDSVDNNGLWYMNQQEMDLLSCNKDKKPMTFKSLPSNHKTIYLRFQDLKSKVCKPFSM